MTHPPIRRADLAALDAADPLADRRALFDLPDGVIYLDGNSLGALPAATPARLAEVIAAEWGQGLIRSWNQAGWIEQPGQVGDKIGRLIGGAPESTIVADSTSVNVFKLLSAALALRPDRQVILSEESNFPTDLYIAEGLAAWLGRDHRLELAPFEGVAAAIDARVAVVMLTHVNYRTGAMHDMAAITRAAHAAGALVLWDLAHSAAAVPVDLAGCDADLAVGCGYKYLNGGPGAPAFLYVAPRLQDGLRLPLTGWLGHADPFAFEQGYRPAGGIARAVVGTPAVLGMAALEVGVDIALTVDARELRAKSARQTGMFIDLVEQLCPNMFGLVSPRDGARRGSQVCFSHPDAFAIMQALIARGVIGDFRAPDILRFGIASLYISYTDLWEAAAVLADIMRDESWKDPKYAVRGKVT